MPAVNLTTIFIYLGLEIDYVQRTDRVNIIKRSSGAQGSRHRGFWGGLEVRNLTCKRRGCFRNLNPWPPGLKQRNLTVSPTTAQKEMGEEIKLLEK